MWWKLLPITFWRPYTCPSSFCCLTNTVPILTINPPSSYQKDRWLGNKTDGESVDVENGLFFFWKVDPQLRERGGTIKIPRLIHMWCVKVQYRSWQSIANGRKPLQPVLTDPFIRLIVIQHANSCVKETLSRAPDWCQSPPSTRLIELGRIFFAKTI